MRSIRRTLSLWILGALSAGALLVVLVSYLVTLEEMHEVFDAELKNIAEGVARYQRALQGQQGAGAALAVASPARSDEPDDSEIVTLAWAPDGQRLYASDPRVQLPFSRTEGLARPTVGGERWIVYTSVGANGGAIGGVSGVAQAAQRLSARQVMACESAAKIVPPLVALVAVVGALLAFGLRRSIEPLDRAARELAARSATSLQAVPAADVPKELAPLVEAINALMARLDEAFQAQRRFVADAAHELRTPITALRLQQQLLERSAGEARRDALRELARGIDRSQRLVEQLLQVARSETGGEPLRRERIDLDALLRKVVAGLSARAERKGIDLGAGAPSAACVEGDRQQLGVLLTNLVENALRYTPRGGTVDVCASAGDGAAELVVRDNGPGIAAHERERVFERFYRGEAAAASNAPAAGSEHGGEHGSEHGSGLGLAIVKAIAQRHGAEVTLHTPAAGRGLEVRVRFAAAAPVPAPILPPARAVTGQPA